MRSFRLSAFLLVIASLAFAEGPVRVRPNGLYAEFTTPHGVFVARLFAERAPMTVTNFVAVAEGAYGRRTDGASHYTDLSWYRVVPGFVVQGGTNLPPERFARYPFPDEFSPGLRHDRAGVLAMANGGPDTNNAIFFVTLDDATRLNYMHTIFGQVVEGLDLLPQIRKDDPFSLRILRVGEAARAFKADEAAFAALVAQGRPYAAETDIGPAAHFDDPDRLLPTDVPRAKNFTYKLANFERFTGLRVYARVIARFTPTADAPTPEDAVRREAAGLGLGDDGVLAVRFADLGRWVLHVGAKRRPAFVGQAPSLESRQAALFAEVDRLAAFYAAQMIAIRGKDDLTPADRLKYSVDGMLDSLLQILEPAPKL